MNENKRFYAVQVVQNPGFSAIIMLNVLLY